MRASNTSTRSRQPRQLNFNTRRIAWILSLLLATTFITQIVLLAYHDDIVLQVNTLEQQLLEDASVVNGILRAAYDYNDATTDDSAGDIVVAQHGDTSSDVRKHQSDVHHNQNEHGIDGDDLQLRNNRYTGLSMEPIEILKRAGINDLSFVPSVTVKQARMATKGKADLRQEAQLPSLDNIQAMYGTHSFTAGLDRCEEFRQSVPPEHRLMGPAGIFNSATNLLNKLLKLNCVNEARQKSKKRHFKTPTGMLLQAPWGKHNPVSWRHHHEAYQGGRFPQTRELINHTEFLPIVMIKDPITWMASMCRHSYEARWRHVPEHCPNLVPNRYDRGRKPGKGTLKLKVKFATKHIGDNEPMPDRKNKTFIEYDSLVELWNEWYNQWRDVKFPRLMVRFEDLMFHAEETVSQVCTCGGGTMGRHFRYVEDSAKGQGGPHAGSAGFLASLVLYGNQTMRMEGILTDKRDLEYAQEHLDPDLMDYFGYASI